MWHGRRVARVCNIFPLSCGATNEDKAAFLRATCSSGGASFEHADTRATALRYAGRPLSPVHQHWLLKRKLHLRPKQPAAVARRDIERLRIDRGSVQMRDVEDHFDVIRAKVPCKRTGDLL